jgi:hypothetical protein
LEIALPFFCIFTLLTHQNRKGPIGKEFFFEKAGAKLSGGENVTGYEVRVKSQNSQLAAIETPFARCAKRFGPLSAITDLTSRRRSITFRSK